MSFDQGAWDAITKLSNEMHNQESLEKGYADVTDIRIKELEDRVAALERRFKKLKKAVWKA